MSIYKVFKGLGPLAALVVSMAVLATALVPAPAQAADHAMSVRGNVWDSAYRDVEGASVVVNIKDGATTVSTDTDTTDSEGFYSVMFLETEWDVGNTIEIVVTFEGKQDTNSTTATDEFVQEVNLTFTFEIPEFGSLVGMALAAVALAAVGVAGLALWKRK